MFGLFKCNHSAKNLHVYKDSTEIPDSEYDGCYTIITHHLICVCGEHIDIKYAKPDDEKLLARARAKANK